MQLSWKFCAGALLCAFIVQSCAPEAETPRNFKFSLDIRQPAQQKILDLQDRQQRDSLLLFFDNPDPNLRYRAAMAFASMRDSTAVPRLGKLLSDPDPHVQVAAAYALGQSGARQAEQVLVQGFQQHDSLLDAVALDAAILEAVGKTGSKQSLLSMSTVRSYRPSDTLLILGQARGIYRFALRSMVLPEGTARMVEIVSKPSMPAEARLLAANYLFRAAGIKLTEYTDKLAALAENDPDPDIRMCLVVAIAKTASPDARQVLSRMMTREQDFRVKCNILRSLQYFQYDHISKLAFANIDNRNLHLARLAATYLVDYGTERDAADYRSLSKRQLPWEVKTLLYGASNRYLSSAYAITKGNINSELRDWFDRSKNPYEKAAILDAYAKDANNFSQIPVMGYADKEAPVRTAAVDALSHILEDKRFAQQIGTNVTSARRSIATYLVDAIKTGDPGMIAAAATTLAKSGNGLYDYTRAHLEALESALIALELPRDVEAYDALADCIAKLKGETYVHQTVAFNHPIPWDLVDQLPDIVKAEVVTSRGTIKMDLFTQEAPGSVMNFVQLARDHFFNGKNFHRVVPNFVIQGGCPRGDGYGSLDYTIRSELGPEYYDRDGSIGMASAGNHTECTQWFITYCPTPHLDGNYTLFGRVTSGMDIVQSIQIGDEIREINIL